MIDITTNFAGPGAKALLLLRLCSGRQRNKQWRRAVVGKKMRRTVMVFRLELDD
jgi:hypothetical protein